MKYLLLTLEYPPFKAGIAHYYGHLVKYFPEPIEVVNNADGRLVDEKRKFLKWWPAIKVLRQEIQDKKIDYVLVGQILPLGTVAWLLSFVLDFKYCVFLHGLDFSAGWSQPRKRALIRAILNRANKIVAANSHVERQVKNIVPTADLSKITCVNPGVEADTVAYDETKIEELKKRYNLANKTVLLTVGRLVRRKGVDMVLEALNLAKNELTSLVFVIIGQGEEEAYLKLKISHLGLGDHVLILKNIDDEEKMNWYKLADIFIMTARQIGPDYEGFGIVYLEAGLAGKPVIAGNSGGVGDAVADNINGLLVNPIRPEEIKEAIIKLAKYPAIRNRLGDEGRRRALEDFNWQGQAEKIFKFLN
jgi:phosphatidylinositol alpha-1,6-mannosyltransferase